DFGGGVGTVAEFVLQPLDPNAVVTPVRQYPRHQEAGQPARRLGEGEEHIGHRGGGEPLVPHEDVSVIADRGGGGGVRSHVGTALFLGHRHARDQGAFVLRRPQAVIVLWCRQQWFVGSCQRGGVRQRGERRVGVGGGAVGERVRLGVWLERR